MAADDVRQEGLLNVVDVDVDLPLGDDLLPETPPLPPVPEHTGETPLPATTAADEAARRLRAEILFRRDQRFAVQAGVSIFGAGLAATYQITAAGTVVVSGAMASAANGGAAAKLQARVSAAQGFADLATSYTWQPGQVVTATLVVYPGQRLELATSANTAFDWLAVLFTAGPVVLPPVSSSGGTGSSVDLVEVGGTAQTGANWSAYLASVAGVTGAPGTTAPATATQVAGTDGADLRALSTDTSGHLNVNAAQSGAWTVDAAQDGTLDVNAAQSGAWTVADSTLAGATGAPGTAAPADAVQVAGTDGSDLRVLRTLTNGTAAVSTAPVTANYVPTGTAAAATTPILATYGATKSSYAVTQDWTLTVGVALSAAATLSVTHDAGAGTPSYNTLNAGQTLAASAEYAFSIPVRTGDAVDFQVSAAVTLNVFSVFFAGTM